MFLHFKNINSKYALYDRHMHTNWTDGKNTIEEMIEAAEKLGMKEIALTDHVRGTSTYYNDYVRKIKYLRKKTKVNVIIGFECKIKNFDGEIDEYPKSWFIKAKISKEFNKDFNYFKVKL